MTTLPQLAQFDAGKFIQMGQAGQQQRTLADVGRIAATGDYQGATNAAFAGGQPDLAAHVASMGADQHQRIVEDAARGAYGADTPEKWDAFATQFQQTHPTIQVPPFQARQQVIDAAVPVAQQMQMRSQQLLAQRAQDNADRSYNLQVQSQANQQAYRYGQLPPSSYATAGAGQPATGTTTGTGQPATGAASDTSNSPAVAQDYTTRPIPEAGNLTQAAIDQKALGYVASGQNPPVGRTGIAGMQNIAVSNRMAVIGGNLTANKADAKALSSALTQNIQYANNTQRAFNTANDTLNALTSWMQQNGVNPSQYPDYNQFTNFLKSKGLDPGAAGGYNAQIATLRSEYAQVLARGGTVTDQSRSAASALIPDGLSPAQLQTVADRLKVDATNVVNDAQKQISQIHDQIYGIAQLPGGQPSQASSGAPQQGGPSTGQPVPGQSGASVAAPASVQPQRANPVGSFFQGLSGGQPAPQPAAPAQPGQPLDWRSFFGAQ